MPHHFCVSIRLLASEFHGRRDGNGPEWPPSPLRIYQALLAAAVRRAATGGLPACVRSAFLWLERQAAPVLIAPAATIGSGYRLSVPNNAMDIVARAWCRGNISNSGDANLATHRTMKGVRPMLLGDGDALHYLWPLGEPVDDEVRSHVGSLAEAARSIAALGWGIDMAVGNAAIAADEHACALSGERWVPIAGARGDGLRVPVPGTFDALVNRHAQFLNRLGQDGFTAPPPLTKYESVPYRCASDPPARPIAAFSLLRPDATGFRAFDTPRRALTVAGMTRHATQLAARRAARSEAWINTFVLGHGEAMDGADHISVGPQRFAYLPLPSIEARGNGQARVAGSVRRVILCAFAEECEAEIAWARRALSGQELLDKDKAGTQEHAVAFLATIPSNDTVVRRYTEPAACWATVTPVVLPGFDDPAHYWRRLNGQTGAEEQERLLSRLAERIDGLLRKAIVQAGFPFILADHAELEWRKSGFWPGTDLADRYGVPDHLERFSRYHVRLCWRSRDGKPLNIPGPICLGGGRFYGLGLFAATPF